MTAIARLSFGLMLLATPAAAVDPDSLTREDKALYLRCAYAITGSTTTLASVDLSGWSRQELELCVDPKPFAEAEAVPTPEPKPVLMKADRPVSDICTRAGMRKVITNGGDSWRCRR